MQIYYRKGALKDYFAIIHKDRIVGEDPMDKI